LNPGRARSWATATASWKVGEVSNPGRRARSWASAASWRRRRRSCEGEVLNPGRRARS
jgi:hypothetical protein